MKAAVLLQVGEPLEVTDVAEPRAEAGQAVVELNAAALNRRGYWITQGQYPGIQCPVVLGSDGAGRVREVGAGVNDTWKGREVIINPGRSWGRDERVQSDEFRILRPIFYSSRPVSKAGLLWDKDLWKKSAARWINVVPRFYGV